MRNILTLLCASALVLLLHGCSWIVHFYVVNNSAASRSLEIQLSKNSDAFLIFEPRRFSLLPWNDRPDYEHERRIPQAWRENLTIEIPPHSALAIGRLNNDHYDNTRQYFINRRVFNLVRLRCGEHEVTRDTFDKHFQKTSAGVVWEMPD